MNYRRYGHWISDPDTGYHYILVEASIWRRVGLNEDDKYLLYSELPDMLQLFLQMGG